MKRSTELVFILDRSGSMGGLESDTITGFNTMLKKQKKLKDECRVTTVLFDHEYEVLHDRIDILGVKALTAEEYYTRGSTALLDAVGKTIDRIIKIQKNTAEQHQADRVMFIITTDGMENSSHYYSYQNIKKLISRQKKHYNWEFIFLGANIDSLDVAGRMGISKNRIKNYHNDAQGIKTNYDTVSSAICDLRGQEIYTTIDETWGDEIDKDYNTDRV